MLKRGSGDTEYVLFFSYGKDSTACLGALEHLGWPLDRIVTADIWATDRIPAEYPPVVEYKKKADKLIKQRYGITVEHFCATKVDGVEKEKVTSNENQNGLIRRHIPKGTDLSTVPPGEVKRVEAWLNHYPRKMFGYLCSEQLFQEQVALILAS